jgi:DNA replication ATP-dependent helicase Dna2
MIQYKDILDYFYLEAEEAKSRWKTLMQLPLCDRIRKRKAIKSIMLDKEYKGKTEDHNVLLKLITPVNLSDFKEGDCLILHEEDSISGIKCVINRFENEDIIIIEVYPFNLPSNLSSYYDTELILDKDIVDLRENVYDKFISQLSGDEQYWKSNVLNSRSFPIFENIKQCEEELDDTIKKIQLKLLPAQREAILKSMAAEDYYLIQGPPGTGKSFILGLIMLEEVIYFKRKVIVIGPNHLAINNALKQFFRRYPYDVTLKVGQSYNAANTQCIINDERYEIFDICYLNVSAVISHEGGIVIGCTPHSLYTSRTNGLRCDTLIVDEAGQMTIPLALMGMIKAKKVIFAGDHKQLSPIISSDKISKEMSQSIFQALITKDNCTMLDTSFRMCGPLCDFVSELFYENKLNADKKGCGEIIVCEECLYSFETPIVIHNIDDNGEQTSNKEAEYIVNIIAGYYKRKLPLSEIAVLSPFRAQAANIRRHIKKLDNIAENDRVKIAIDTIDKMQGQEREVIVFSLTAGNIDYMNEMAEFLYNPNKLNVAFSRAKSKLIIVGNINNLKQINLNEYPHILKMMSSKNVTMV